MRIAVLLILALLAGAAGVVAISSETSRPALACSANGGC
jgi:hypothetical protein